jgi:hypothetical protein
MSSLLRFPQFSISSIFPRGQGSFDGKRIFTGLARKKRVIGEKKLGLDGFKLHDR